MTEIDVRGSNFYFLFIGKYDPDSKVAQCRVKELSGYLKKHLKKGRILDLGCGCGLFSFDLEKEGFRVTGVDFNKKNLDIAKRYIKKINSKVEFIYGNLTNFKHYKKYENIILLGNTIPHFSLNDFDLILQNIKKNLLKGGRFLLEYSDQIGSLLTNYPMTFIEQKSPRIISKHVGYSCKEGALFRDFDTGKKKFRLKLMIWSPYILDYIMKIHGFKNIKHYKLKRNKFFSVYEKK